MTSPAAGESAIEAPPAPAASAARRGRYFGRMAWFVVLHVAFVVGLFFTAKVGLERRAEVYGLTEPLRFTWDMWNAQRWGAAAANDGFFPLYDDVVHSPNVWYSRAYPDKPQYDLDYSPLRLAIMTAWARWARQEFPQQAPQASEEEPGKLEEQWGWIGRLRNLPKAIHPPGWLRYPDYDFVKPMLYFNTGIEVASSVAIFWLVYLWVMRRERAPMEPTLLWGYIGRGWRWIWGDPPPLRLPERRPLTLRTHYRAMTLGLAGAVIFWFNPATTISSHVWPQWDIWPTPFFLFAVLLGCLDWWFVAGVLLMVGTSLKGQLAVTVPMFILWTIFELRFAATLRLVIGLALGAGLIVSPWLLRYPYNDPAVLNDPVLRTLPFNNPAARHWVVILVASAALICSMVVWRRHSALWYLATGAAAALASCIGLSMWVSPPAGFYMAALWAIAVLVWLSFRLQQRRSLWIGYAVLAVAAAATTAVFFPQFVWPIDAWVPKAMLLAIALAGLAILLPVRAVPYLLAAALAAGIWTCIPLFNASTAWYEISIKYGQYHWGTMYMGTTANLPTILADHWGWGLHSIVTVIEPGQFLFWPREPKKLMLEDLLSYILMGTVTISALAAAIHHRRNDARFLIAVTVPWIAFYTIPLHIHERYLIWAAGVSAVFVAASWGMTFLGFAVSFLAWVMVALKVFPPARAYAPKWNWFIGPMMSLTPISWVVILCTVMYLFAALVPSRRHPRRKSAAPRELPAPPPLEPTPALVNNPIA